MNFLIDHFSLETVELLHRVIIVISITIRKYFEVTLKNLTLTENNWSI